MNKQEPFEDDIQTATLADLPLTGEQAEKATAGGGVVEFIGPPATSELKKVGTGSVVFPNKQSGAA